MTTQRSDARRRQRRAAAWIAATVLSGRSAAQSFGDDPELVGFPAGPVVIAPSLTTGYAYDSNVFKKSDDDVPPPSGDGVLTVQPALVLTVPFSNSSFRFGDTLTYVDYSATPQTAGKTSNDALAELVLNFSSLDKLDLKAHHVAGVADTLAFDPGGEQVFQGQAFRLHALSASLSRELPGARGYRASLTHNALNYDQSNVVSFFDYRGFDGELAYLQPLSSNTRLAFGYLATRYDHFDNNALDPHAVFRTEYGDVVYSQIEGRLGPKQPYSVRLGWEKLTFGGNEAKDFSGLIGHADVSVIVGGGTEILVTLMRQPFRSFFEDGDNTTVDNNFYVYEDAGLRINRRFPRGSSVGGSADFSRNTYAEPVRTSTIAPFFYREDRMYRLETYANLALRDQVVFRLSLVKQRKYSNYPGADFNDTVVFGGFVLGWI
jgi:hypothetical protein